MSYRKTWTALLASAVFFNVISPAAAQDSWPTKPITYVVPFPAGGTTDTFARIKLPFDPVKDFTRITLIGTNPLVLIAVKRNVPGAAVSILETHHENP